jgi:Integrase core domain
MADKHLAKGMPVDLSRLPQLCKHCVLGKQTKTPVPKKREGKKATRLLEKVHSDIMGPEDVHMPDGGLYALNFIDNYSDKTWVYILKKKSDATPRFKEWCAIVEKETGLSVQIYRTDNGGEFKSSEFEHYLSEQGIRHQVTAPYTSAHNGKSERCHRTLFNRARAIMSDNQFHPKLWGEWVLTAAYIKDRTPTKSLKDKTPFEAYYGERPDLSNLCEIGCKAFVLIQNEDRPKIYARSIECVLVGYSQVSKAYRCYNTTTGHIMVSRNVQFIKRKDSVPRPYRPGIVTDPKDGTNTPIHMTLPIQGTASSNLPADPNIDNISEGEPPEPPQPTLHRSTRHAKPSAAGSAMRSIPHRTHLSRALQEIRDTHQQHLRDDE